MEKSSTIDSAEALQNLLVGAKSNPQAMVDLMMAKALGMQMLNAVAAQQQAQMINNATTASTCARIIEAGEDKGSSKSSASASANMATDKMEKSKEVLESMKAKEGKSTPTKKPKS